MTISLPQQLFECTQSTQQQNTNNAVNMFSLTEYECSLQLFHEDEEDVV